VNVGLFFIKEDREQIISLYEKIKTIPEVDKIHNYQIGRNWESMDGKELKYILSQLDHLVIYLSIGLLSSRWLAYFSGFCSGANIHLSMYTKDVEYIPKAYLNTVKYETSLSKLLKTLEDDLKVRHQVKIIEEAREYLVNRGLGLNENTLCDLIDEGDFELVFQYLKSGFSPNSTDDKGIPLLNHAIRKEQLEIFNLLIEKNADVNLIAKDRGNSALMDACVIGLKDYVAILLDRGAETEIKSKNGQTALMMAVGDNHLEIVKLLVKKKADPNVADALGMSAMKYAKLFNKEEILAVLETAVPVEAC
jgi:hypothetical protein